MFSAYASYITKAIVAAVGAALMFVHRWSGVEVVGMEPMITDVIIGVLTTAGVFVSANGPKPGAEDVVPPAA